jgi:hypothetical protein
MAEVDTVSSEVGYGLAVVRVRLATDQKQNQQGRYGMKKSFHPVPFLSKETRPFIRNCVSLFDRYETILFN